MIKTLFPYRAHLHSDDIDRIVYANIFCADTVLVNATACLSPALDLDESRNLERRVSELRSAGLISLWKTEGMPTFDNSLQDMTKGRTETDVTLTASVYTDIARSTLDYLSDARSLLLENLRHHQNDGITELVIGKQIFWQSELSKALSVRRWVLDRQMNEQVARLRNTFLAATDMAVEIAQEIEKIILVPIVQNLTVLEILKLRDRRYAFIEEIEASLESFTDAEYLENYTRMSRVVAEDIIARHLPLVDRSTASRPMGDFSTVMCRRLLHIDKIAKSERRIGDSGDGGAVDAFLTLLLHAPKRSGGL